MSLENDHDTLLWKVFRKSFKAMEAFHLKTVESLELGGLSDFAVLEVLRQRGPLPVNTIGRKVLLTSGSITAAVDRLEKKNWVNRQAHREDRRVVEVHLTESGRAIIDEAFIEHSLAMENAFAILDDEDKEDFDRILKKLNHSVERKNRL